MLLLVRVTMRIFFLTLYQICLLSKTGRELELRMEMLKICWESENFQNEEFRFIKYINMMQYFF